MEDLSIGRVILAPFPFSNLADQKIRPCLIIGIAEFNDIIVCQITSKSYSSNNAITLKNTDFLSGSIIVDSFIRPDKIATLDQTTIKKELGTLKEKKVLEIKAALKKIFEITSD